MQPERLIELFNAHRVKYLLIGAVACSAHGFTRATSDIDIFIEATPANAQKTLDALAEFGYDITELTIEDVLKFKLLFRRYWLDTDIHPFVTGASFKSAWKNRFSASISGIPTHYVSLNDLIRMKRAAGRPKDKEDLRYLLRLKKLKKKNNIKRF